MIEFTQDGPFANKADQLFPDRVRIIGLGQTGTSVCDQLVLHGRPSQDLWAFDSDQQTIDGSVVPNRHLLGSSLVHGLGCCGDLALAREIVALEENLLAPVVRGCDFLILVVGLSGATGVATAERLLELGREAGAKVIVVGVQPFACEGWERREKAIQAIAGLRREADSVLILSHDRLAQNPTTRKNIRHGFHLMHELLAKTSQALSQVVCKRGLIQLSFADVRSLYGRYVGSEVLENCWVAHVEGTSHDCTEDLVTELLEGPLLADEAIWKQVDHAIVAVSGTRALGLLDVQELVGALKERLPVNIPIATSASLDEEHHNRVRVSVLLAMTAPMPGLAEGAALPAKKPFSDTMVLPDLKATARLPVPEKKTAAPPAPPLVPVAAIASVAPGVAAAPFEPSPPLPPVVPVKARPGRPLVTPATLVKPVARPVLAPIQAPLPIKTENPVLEEEMPLSPPAAVEEEFIEYAESTEQAAPAAWIDSLPLPPVNVTRRAKVKQAEMQFEAPVRSRFEKTHETMYRGENLDQPTFRRRGLAIRL